jgi:subtilisin family serine protease
VAGIVGADGELRGVAPDVELGAYRVFGCGGSTTADVIVAALEMAHADGMDVVNMSIGAAFATWPQYPTAAASDALVEDGVVVVASIGNSGADGVWSAGAPGVGEQVIGVASFDNTQYDAAMFTVSPDDLPVAYTIGSGVPAPPTEGSAPLTATGTPETPDDGCEPIEEDLSGSIAMVQRGTCFFYVKAYNAWQAGAEAVILYNNVAGGFNPSLAPPSADDPPIEVPVVAITHDDGVELHERISGDGAELTWTEETLTVENPTGGLISSFSSFGLTADLQVKPDLGAPGGLINSTYPLERGGYAVNSGTSMSAPHVAGAVALLLQAHPGLAPGEVRDTLQNSAVPADTHLAPGSGLLEPVHRQGAGMLAIDRAITSTTAIAPGKLALGESAGGPVTRSVTLTNNGDAEVTYALGNAEAVSTGDLPSDPGHYLGGSTADFGAAEVTVPAGGSAEVTVTITAPDSPDQGVYGGYLVFTPEVGDPLRVPYAGFIGDYQSVEAMGPGAHGFPFLASLTECDRLIGVDCTMNGAWSVHPDGGATYSMADGDFPTLLVHLDYPARSLEIRLYEANADGSKGDRVGGVNNRVLAADFLGRSASQGSFTPYVWDGTREKSRGRGGNAGGTKRVPNGDYVLEVTVLKALGDADNPDHVETWTSPAFTVERGR